jgi:hypothetical protein
MRSRTRVAFATWMAAMGGAGLAVVTATGCSFGSKSSDEAPDAHFESGSANFDGGGGDTGKMPESGAEASSHDAGDAGEAGPPCGGDGGPGTFTCSGDLGTARIAPNIGALPGGKVLVAGGWNSTSQTLETAEVFDPVSGTSTPTGSMSSDHLWGGWGGAMPAVTGGQLLVAGGLDSTGALVSAAELYDPVGGTFTLTGPMPTAVVSMFPRVLGDGSVLYVGGWNSTTGAPPTPGWMYTGSGTSVVQRYTPSAGTFATTGPLAENRLVGCNVVLPTGDVLAIGGSTGMTSTEPNIEQYDPAAGTWQSVGTLTTPAQCTQAFLLSTGKVLMIGTGATPDAQLFDPSTFTATPTTGEPSGWSPQYQQLASGDVLGMGSDGTTSPTAAAWVYHVATNTWTQVGDMGVVRSGAFVTAVLATGDVAIVGGSDSTGAALTSVEIYHP